MDFTTNTSFRSILGFDSLIIYDKFDVPSKKKDIDNNRSYLRSDVISGVILKGSKTNELYTIVINHYRGENIVCITNPILYHRNKKTHRSHTFLVAR